MAGLLTNSERTEKRAAVDALNQQAMRRFETLYEQGAGGKSQHAQTHWSLAKHVGLPAFRHEDWHYTPLNSVLNTQYRFSSPNQQVQLSEALALPIDAYRIVLVDGRYNAELSSVDTGEFQVSLLDSQDWLPDAVSSEIFLHLTECLAVQPLIIQLAANKVAAKPLYLLNISSSSHDPEAMNMSQYRYHLTLGNNSQSHVIEHFVSLDDQPHLTGGRLTVEVGDNVQFTHFKLMTENASAQHFAHNDIIVGRDSVVKSSSFYWVLD